MNKKEKRDTRLSHTGEGDEHDKDRALIVESVNKNLHSQSEQRVAVRLHSNVLKSGDDGVEGGDLGLQALDNHKGVWRVPALLGGGLTLAGERVHLLRVDCTGG